MLAHNVANGRDWRCNRLYPSTYGLFPADRMPRRPRAISWALCALLANGAASPAPLGPRDAHGPAADEPAGAHRRALQEGACASLSQYASTAEASQEYGGGWAATEATGAPTHSGCASGSGGAWAPRYADNTEHTLTLTYDQPQHVSEVRVWEHANPPEASGFISRISLIDGAGRAHPWYAGPDDTECGGVLAAARAGELTDYLVHAVEVRTQTLVASGGWEYIDAVQIVGSSCPCTEQSQYATAAEASQEYGGSWAASEAVGAPTHSGCASGSGGSWAPRYADNTEHTLTVTYGRPQYVSQVRVWEHGNPAEASGFVSRISLIDGAGLAHPWFGGDDDTACGGTLSAVGDLTDYLVHAVEVRTQTHGHDGAWEYIDAVQIVGSNCAPSPGVTSQEPIQIAVIHGRDGRNGTDGLAGLRGAPGRHGINGSRGEQGERGRQGEAGAPGRDGVNGTQGLRGERGEAGEAGERGEPGRDGAKGETGAPGAPGAPGAQGLGGSDATALVAALIAFSASLTIAVIALLCRPFCCAKARVFTDIDVVEAVEARAVQTTTATRHIEEAALPAQSKGESPVQARESEQNPMLAQDGGNSSPPWAQLAPLRVKSKYRVGV